MKLPALVLTLCFASMAFCLSGYVSAQTSEMPHGAEEHANQALRTDSGYISPFDGIKKAYGAITTLEALFKQKVFIAALKKERESSGEFLFKRHKGFLWRYRAPSVKLFLFDGNTMWQSEQEKSFVIKERVSKDKTAGTFLDLIEDIAKIDDLFTLKQESKVGDLEVLELLPKKDGTVTSAKIWIDKDYVVRKIELREFTGNTNAIEFSSIRINPPLSDAKFIFKPGPEKEVIER
jgi:chaperone LolA